MKATCGTQSAGRPSASLSRLANASGERSFRPSSSSSQESFLETKCETAGHNPSLPLSSPNVRLGIGSAMPRAARIQGEKGRKCSVRVQQIHKFRDKSSNAIRGMQRHAFSDIAGSDTSERSRKTLSFKGIQI